MKAAPDVKAAVERSARGAAAGLAATAAMSVVMLIADRREAVAKPPPEDVVEAGLDKAGRARTERQENVLATATHVGYGVAVGALFGLVRPRLPLPAPAAGTVYGMALAVAGYEGWVPALDVLPPLHDQPSGLRRTVVVSHLVYGAVLDWLVSSRR